MVVVRVERRRYKALCMTLFPRRPPPADRPLDRLRTRPCTDPRLSDIPPARRTLIRLRTRPCTDPRPSDIPPSRRTLDRLRTRRRAPNPTINHRRRLQRLSPLRTDPPSAAAASPPLSPYPEPTIKWTNCETGVDSELFFNIGLVTPLLLPEVATVCI